MEMAWKEAVVTWLKVLSQYLPEGIEENDTKTWVGIAGLRTEIWTRDLPYMKQECSPPDGDIFSWALVL
jgi:hypothetical protein